MLEHIPFGAGGPRRDYANQRIRQSWNIRKRIRVLFEKPIMENLCALLCWFAITAFILVFFAGINQIVDWFAGK